MKRSIDMNEVSDGRFYTSRDMARVGCDDCRGCSDCCRGMGESIVLDPYDCCRLTKGLGVTFEELLAQGKTELNVVDGVILPNLKMSGAEEACGFLNTEGRCEIHPLRPGICRIFPLGRYYENGSFRYFLQVHECKKEPKTKVKIQKWVDTPQLRQYEKFVADWHYFLNRMEERLEHADSDHFRKALNLYLLKNFYQKPWREGGDFYEEFYERLEEAKKL